MQGCGRYCPLLPWSGVLSGLGRIEIDLLGDGAKEMLPSTEPVSLGVLANPQQTTTTTDRLLLSARGPESCVESARFRNSRLQDGRLCGPGKAP